MSSKVKLASKVSWPTVIPGLVILGGFVLAGYAVIGDAYGVMLGAFLFLVLSRSLRATLLRHHNRGMELMKQDLYKQAIPHFEEARALLERHRWVDKYRAVTLMSPGQMSYREIAMANLAACHMQVGETKTAIEMWQEMLQEFPDSEIAKNSLQFVESMKGMEQGEGGGGERV